MSAALAKKWAAANSVADCDCEGIAASLGVNTTIARGYSGGAVTRWANEFEYWNYGRAWHLLCASLMLDGAPCEDLP